MHNYTFLNLGMHPLANSYLKKKELIILYLPHLNGSMEMTMEIRN